MTMDLYIYYRVRVADAEAFRERVLAMQDALARQCGITTALKRRPAAQDDTHTWMEVYLATAADFEEQLERAVAANGLPAFIEGTRHTEQFVDLSLCA